MSSLSKSFLVSAFFATAATTVVRADYQIIKRLPVGGTDASRYDYLRVDVKNRHLFVSHDKRFEVIDLESGKKIGEIGPTSRAHGIAIAPEQNRGFATSGNDNAIIMFDLATLKTISIIKSPGTNPDSIEYDADTKHVFAVNGSSGNVTVIDPAQGKVLGLVALDKGKLEQIGFDGRGRAFVNNEVKSCVHVFDTHKLKALGVWPLAPGEGGTGLAVDSAHHRLFATCGNEKLVVLDSDSGKVIATPTIGEDADGVVFDPSTQQIFTSNANSTLTVLHEDSPSQFTVTQTVETAEGSKTLGFDDKTGNIYLATAKFGPKPEPTKEVPEPRAPVVPGTLEVLVVAK